MASRLAFSARKRKEHNTNVLVVDDQSTMRELIRGMLRRNGYINLVTADNGKLAMEYICSRPFDIVMTDWNMPNMTGIELVKWLKGDARFFRIPVLMISDEMTADKVLYAVEEGADGFLVKPFSEVKLIEYMGEILERAASSGEIEEKIFEMRLLKLDGKYRETFEVGNEILKTRSNSRVAMMVCECLYHLEEFDKAIGMMMDTDEEVRTSEHNNLLGKLYMAVGNQEQGLLFLEQAVEKNPLNLDRRIDLARAYFSAGRSGDAERIVERMLNMNLTDMNLVNIAQVYLDWGDVAKAGSCLDKTVDPIPETVHVFNNYAVALRKANRYEESVLVYRKCLAIVPDSDVIHYNIGLLYKRIGQLDEARRMVHKAVGLNPENTHARKLLKELESGPVSS